MSDIQAPNSVRLEALVRSLELDWRLDLFGNSSQRLSSMEARLEEADKVAKVRFTDGSVRLTLDTLTSIATQSPDRVRTFVAQLFDSGAPEMLVMGWRMLTGAQVGGIRLDLKQATNFHLEVVLWPDRIGTEEKYESDDVFDIHLLGQFGVSKLNGQLPLLVGFYPTLRRPK